MKTENTISFYTFGCRLNQSETAVITRTCEANGYKIVDFKKPANITVINTCTVTENGDADTRKLIQKIIKINPQSQIALVGCQAQTQKEKLATLPNVRWIIGNAKKMDLHHLLKEHKKEDAPFILTPNISRDSFTVPMAGIDYLHTRANIKIQDGCDFFCSYCEIPYARGRARSRKFDDILLEAQTLANAGHKELVITGINVGTYKNQNKSIIDVIKALEQIEKLKRIRISSIEPTTVSISFLKEMRKIKKLCRHIHIPMQSGSNPILKKMKRKYTVEEFSQFVKKAYEIIPEICIGTDVIVGFPGETEEYFNETVSTLRELPIHYFHVFSYSKRTMTKSQDLSDVVKTQEINKRSKILRELSLRKRKIFLEGLLNTEQIVLFEQKKDDLWTGLTDNYGRVFAKSKNNLENQFFSVRLTLCDNMRMLGEIV